MKSYRLYLIVLIVFLSSIPASASWEWKVIGGGGGGDPVGDQPIEKVLSVLTLPQDVKQEAQRRFLSGEFEVVAIPRYTTYNEMVFGKQLQVQQDVICSWVNSDAEQAQGVVIVDVNKRYTIDRFIKCFNIAWRVEGIEKEKAVAKYSSVKPVQDKLSIISIPEERLPSQTPSQLSQLPPQPPSYWQPNYFPSSHYPQSQYDLGYISYTQIVYPPPFPIFYQWQESTPYPYCDPWIQPPIDPPVPILPQPIPSSPSPPPSPPVPPPP